MITAAQLIDAVAAGAALGMFGLSVVMIAAAVYMARLGRGR